MKNKILIITAIVTLGFIIQSCNLVIDKDTTSNISFTSIKPVMELLGEPIIEMTVGGTYVEAGVSAMAGDTVLDYTILEGAVDPGTLGYYVVVYEAVNGFGWASKAYRAVLVHDGTPYGDDITGAYKLSFLFNTNIKKHSINGYWEIENVFQQDGVVFPIVFADKGDGTYGVVPGEHPTKGFYTGTVVKNGTQLVFTMKMVSPSGIKTTKTFTWTKA